MKTKTYESFLTLWVLWWANNTRILAEFQVQEDLKQLKERLLLAAANGDPGSTFDISTLENAISHTEKAILVSKLSQIRFVQKIMY